VAYLAIFPWWVIALRIPKGAEQERAMKLGLGLVTPMIVLIVVLAVGIWIGLVVPE
jgi:hypothetical protein